ncbi:MFS transporter [Microbacterium gorillae]|uniref:MFS transporter n=1 Tax=Microbacterium gorillae TaxID=1231063 RepID=UPI000693A913|nr:MFS transporter [Microbacterium gorillae]
MTYQDNVVPAVAPPRPVEPRKTPGKAALASFLGGTLEYYDFFIYGTAAALVFPSLFFPGDNPTAGLVAAFATFGVAYVARPLGGMVMGHFGDRIGRKRVLQFTIVLMGLASLSIGLLPTYAAIGIFAPILLTLARLVQGFSAGAESAGASSLTLEHSPQDKRGLFTSSVMMGYAGGMVLSTLVFIPITALPEDALLSWGWRVPFLLSIVVLALAYWVRRHLDETPVFEEAKEEGELKKVPLRDVLRFQALDVVRVLFMSIFSVMQTIFTVFGLSYATEEAGFGRAEILTVNAIAIGLSMITMPLLASLSDKIGRKPVIGTAMLGCLLTLPVYFLALGTGNIVLVFLAALLFMTVLYSGFNGLWPGFFAEQFATPIRYSGMALGNQLGLLVAGFGPMIGGLLLGTGEFGWVPVAIFGGVCAALGLIALLSSRETAHTPIEQLGEPYWRKVGRR